MARFITFLLLTAFSFAACDKSEVNKQRETLSVSNVVKTGDWMVLYFENNVSMDIGVTFIKFSSTGSAVATKDGTNYNGTWTEANTGGNHTITINIATTDSKLQLANGTWKVVNIAENLIDLKDTNVSGKATIQLMKH